MTNFLSILAFYYLCDSTAALRPLNSSEVAACMKSYEAVKTHFIAAETETPPSTVLRGDQNRRAFLRFKSWEVENSTIVTRMKTDARHEALRALQG